MPKNKNPMRLIFAAAMLTFIIIPALVFCQSADGSLSGIVKDPQKKVVIGAIVTVKNKATDVETMRSTDDSGRYGFLSLTPGLYKMTVDMPDFNQWKGEVQISTASQQNKDVLLEIGIIDGGTGGATADPIRDPLDPNPSIIQAFSKEYLTGLPNPSNNAIDYVYKMGGVQLAPNSGGLDQGTAWLMGTPAPAVAVMLDGMYVNEYRWDTGINTPIHINPDNIEEFQVALSMVDAESHSGALVNMRMKGGANQFRGSINSSGNNSFLNSGWNRNNFANSFNKQRNYSVSFSGPIIQRKLFFFVNWDRTLSRNRTDVTPIVMTPCARKGIYRYFSGWDNGNAYQATQTGGMSGGNPIIATVHADGTPATDKVTLQPDNSTPSTLQLQSVFGQLDPHSMALLSQDPVNCSAYDPYTNLGVSSYWETGTSTPGLRLLDPVTVPRFSAMMPLPNNYEMAMNGGDGLNTAVNKWTRVGAGMGSAYASMSGMSPNRKDLNTNIDYNYSDRHRIRLNYMIEFMGGKNASELWPAADSGYGYVSAEGKAIRRPQQISTTITSTISGNMLNEARIGLARTVAHQFAPMDDPDVGPSVRKMLEYLVPTDNFPSYKGLPILVGLGPEASTNSNLGANGFGYQAPSSFTFSPEGNGGYSLTSAASHPYGSVNGGLLPTFGGADHRWTITDNFTWMYGAHQIRVGGDARLARSNQDSEGTLNLARGINTQNALTFPIAFGGIADYSIPGWQYPNNLGLVGTQPTFDRLVGGGVTNTATGTYAGMLDLLTYMSGSIADIRQLYFVNNPYQRTWNDVVNKGERYQITDMRQKEFSIFAKDDWRVRPTLTVNLGVRWEYYGVPWLANGMTVGLQGGGLSMFGVTGRGISSWMSKNPAQLDDSYLTKQIFIGPNSPNPDAVLYNQDYNNFGPAVGFSLQLPWLGKGRTIIRSGYQLSYSAVGNASGRSYGASIANEPGTTYKHFYRGSTNDTYMSVANLGDHVPASRFLDPTIVPLDVMRITDHTTNYTAYDPTIRTPYTHNINLSITRVIKNNITVDLRYVGTLRRKAVGDLDINTPNFINNGLVDVLDAARRGENPALLDQMLDGFVFGQIQNWTAVGSTGGPTGADVLRKSNIYQSNLANGNYAAIASSLADLNYDKQVTGLYGGAPRLINQQYPDIPDGVKGAVLRANGFPENYILGNPQLGQAIYRSNLIHSNYHSMQAQVQLRPTRGLMLTSTYTFSKTLADQPGGAMGGFFGGGGGGWTDPLNRTLDYKLNSYGGKHQWNNYGMMDLPIGASGYFLQKLQNGMLKRLLEGWQFSWTLQMQSGNPSQISDGINHLYNNGTLMDLVPIMDPTLNPSLDAKYGMEIAKKLAPSNGNLEWPAGSNQGYYYGGGNAPARYIVGTDPQCYTTSTYVASTFTTAAVGQTPTCSLRALYLAIHDGNGSTVAFDETTYKGRAILVNPMPGHQGNFSRFIEGIGSFSLDMSMSKNIMITEGKSVQVRMQATNILNHPSPCGSGFGGMNYTMGNCPSLSVSNNAGGFGFGGNTPFGGVNQKGGSRSFYGNFRLLF
jgi:hypothetical protein